MILNDTWGKFYAAESKKKGDIKSGGRDQEIPAAFSYSCFNKSVGVIAGTGLSVKSFPFLVTI